MATRKTTTRRKKSAPRKKPAGATGLLRETWDKALRSLSAAEAEVEKQVRDLMAGKGMGAEAAATFRRLGGRLERERRRLAREIESRVSALQQRLQKERRSIGRLVDETVRGALAALNIPSRQEIVELTRKVDALSRKIDGFGETAAPRARSRRPVASQAQA